MTLPLSAPFAGRSIETFAEPPRRTSTWSHHSPHGRMRAAFSPETTVMPSGSPNPSDRLRDGLGGGDGVEADGLHVGLL
jgi:hypothetical protein